MFETFIIQPIFNLLVLIYAIVPGGDFGLAVILFTLVVRMMMWPLLRKQLHQTRTIRELQPEIKQIKAKTKGDKQREGQLLMELYKEKGVNPFGSIGIIFIQLPILIGLFQGLRRLAENKQTVIDLSYSWVRDIGNMKDVVADLNNFDESLYGFVDLTRQAFGEMGNYGPALILAFLAGVFQFFQTRQLAPDQDKGRKLRDILKDESQGKKTDQSEINAAMGKKMRLFFPVITFIFASRVPAALSLYWATGGLIALVQQRVVFQSDVTEMESLENGKQKRGEKPENKELAEPKPKSKKKSKQTRRQRKQK